MLTKSCFGIMLSALLIPEMANANANAVTELKKEYGTAVMQHIGENQGIPMVSYLRAGQQTTDHYDGTDFVYLWHGQNQNSYDLLNIMGMADGSGGYQVPMYFSGVDANSFNSDSESTESSALFKASAPIENVLGVHRRLVAGYDLGVAPAFNAACENSVKNVVLVSGGVYKKSECSPKNMHIIYAISDSDALFPIDKSTSFESKKSVYSTKNRLDGKGTIAKLIDSLQCPTDVLQSNNDEYSLATYHCGHGNELTVVTYNGLEHQWYGYKYATNGVLNQYGSPANKSMRDWISSVLNFN